MQKIVLSRKASYYVLETAKTVLDGTTIDFIAAGMLSEKEFPQFKRELEGLINFLDISINAGFNKIEIPKRYYNMFECISFIINTIGISPIITRWEDRNESTPK